MVSVVLLVVIGRAQYRDIPEVVTKVATASANWLKLETSPRAVGLGGAWVAAGRGISAVPYNPAAIAFLGGSEVFYMRTNYLAGITHNVLSYGRRMTGSDYVGVHLFYLDSGPMEVTNEWYPDGTGEDFHVVSLAFRTVYGRRLTDRLKIGVSLDVIRDQIYTTVMQGVAFDIGSHFDTGIYGFELGMSVVNFGPEVQFHGEGLVRAVPDTIDVDQRLSRVTGKFPLPLLFRLGLRNDVVGPAGTVLRSGTHRVSVAVDGLKPQDYTVVENLGVEYAYREQGFVRVGTRWGHDTAGLSAGAGVRMRTGALTLAVDYAFADYGILKLTHQLGLGLEF